MKTLRIILLFFIVAFCFSCNEVDPIDGENTYTIDNKTNEAIKVSYCLATQMGEGLAGKSSTETIAPQQKTRFLLLYGGVLRWSPSYVFEELVFLSSDNDTLRVFSEIDDNEWIQTDSVSSAPLKPGLPPFDVWFFDWTYTFSN